MKRIMWALYTTKNSKFPREIYNRHSDARWVLFRMKEKGIHWGLIRRIELEFKDIGAYDVYRHEYIRS